MKVYEYKEGTPQRYGEELYWDFARFDLEADEVKQCCYITLRRLMRESDTTMRLYYDMAYKFIQNRGK